MGIEITNYDNYINNWIRKYNKEEADTSRHIKEYLSISFCTKPTAYHILQIQPKATLTVSMDKGLIVDHDSKNYYKKLYMALQKSYDEEYDFVFLPEYSVPLSIIDNMIADSDRINPGTLYCLPCQGVPRSVFKHWIETMLNTDNLIVITKPWDTANLNRIVCCLIYFTKVRFITNNDKIFDKLVIIPQCKTKPMKDEKMDFENNTLTCGREIIVFGKEKEDCFLSMICADVYNYELITKIKGYLISNHKKAIIFHPQLNYRPQHNNFRFTRELFIDYAENDFIRVIALNWAKGTSFKMAGKEIPAITDSWSTIYRVFIPGDIRKYMQILDDNADHGLNFSHDYQVAMFFFPSTEHVVDISMNTLTSTHDPSVIKGTVFLRVFHYLEYNEVKDNFIERHDVSKEMVDGYFWTSEEYERFFIEKDGIKKCSFQRLNRFVSLVYNSSIEKQFEMINNGSVSSVTSKHYGSIYSKEKIYITKRIHRKMKEKEVPQKFKCLTPKFRFDVTGKSDEYNAAYILDDNSESKEDIYCRVVYLKYAKEQDAAKLYDEFYKKDKRFSENLIIYFEDEDMVHLYDKGISTSIIDGETVQNTSSIIGG